MRTAILMLLSLTFSQAHAAGYSITKKMTAAQLKDLIAKKSSPTQTEPAPKWLRNGGTSPGNPSPTPTPMTPIREAKLKAEITKMTIKQESDGSYSVTDSMVCIVTGLAPVYDGRGSGGHYFTFPPLPTCPSTVEGQPVTIGAGGMLLLHTSQVFSDEPNADVKIGYTMMEVLSPGNNAQAFMWDTARTRDINAKSMLNAIGASTLTLCSEASDGSGNIECKAVEGELFFANVEFLD